MLRKLFVQLGLVKATVLVTIVAEFFSVSISASIDFLLHGDVSAQAILFASIVPLIIAPIFNVLFLRLVFQLESLQAKLRDLAIRDELTQAFNRRHWMELAEGELARAKRYGGVFSVILFDIDNFGFGLRFGHLAVIGHSRG